VNRVRLMGLVMAALALVAGCGAATSAGAQAAGASGAAQHTASVPEQLQFTAKTVDGKDFSGQSLVGKPAVLWFWAPWCPICRGEAPTVARVAHSNPAVAFVGVAARDQLPAMRQFVDQYQMGSFPQLADLDGSVWQRFGVTAQPAYAFVTASGAVDVVEGTLSEQQLIQRINQLASS
jgi:thiol-disulfide isomerase/thioredoxin